MRPTGSEKKSSKSKGSSIKQGKARLVRITSPRIRYVVCVKNGEYVDLELLKVYKVRNDPDAKAQGLLRVVDGSGEDYLYPTTFFSPIHASPRLFKMVKELA